MPFSNRLNDLTELTDANFPGVDDDASVEPGLPPRPLSISGGPLFDSFGGKAGHHAPTIALLPDGSLAAAWYSYSGPRETQGAEIFFARLADPSAPVASLRWTPPRRVIGGPLSYGNPVLFAEGGALHMFFCAAPGTWSAGNIRETRSTDNGETWNTPTTVSTLLGGNVRNPPVRRSDGSLLLPAYDDLFQRSLFFVLRDGAAWTLDSTLETPFPARLIQPAIAIADSTRWILAGRNGARGGTWFGVSADEGQTWRVGLQDDIPNPGAAVALLKLESDRYALIFNNSRSDRTNLSIAFATDGGVFWAPPQVIIEGDGEYAYPAATLDRAGVIHLVFSQDRRTIEHRRVALGSQFSGPSAAE